MGGAGWLAGTDWPGWLGLIPGAFPSAACLPSRFPKPPQPITLRDCLVLPLPPSLPLTRSQELTPGAPPAGPQPRPPTAVDPDTEPTLLRHPQVRAQAKPWPLQGQVAQAGLLGPYPLTSMAGGPSKQWGTCWRSLAFLPPPAHWSLSLQGTVVFTTQVPTLGRYAFLLHGYQPAHPTFPVEVLINGGRVWQGEWL
jgi:hypothetical protein